MTEPDWRLQGQEGYLAGITLIRREWRQSRPNWDHDHCEFCGVEFGAENRADVLHQGWTTADDYRWICDVCVSDFKVQFKWRIEETQN